MKDNEGWQSERCTAPKCRQILENGQGSQFRDERGREQRFCWKHWVAEFRSKADLKSPETAPTVERA
jgi:hypothetical protein